MDTFSMYMEKHEVHVKIGDLKKNIQIWKSVWTDHVG